MHNPGERMQVLRHQIDLLELEFSEAAWEFAQTAQYEDEGSTTPIDWIRFHCHMTGPAAGDRVKVGKHLPQLAESAQAVGEGEIGFAHVSRLERPPHRPLHRAPRPADVDGHRLGVEEHPGHRAVARQPADALGADR